MDCKRADKLPKWPFISLHFATVGEKLDRMMTKSGNSKRLAAASYNGHRKAESYSSMDISYEVIQKR